MKRVQITQRYLIIGEPIVKEEGLKEEPKEVTLPK